MMPPRRLNSPTRVTSAAGSYPREASLDTRVSGAICVDFDNGMMESERSFRGGSFCIRDRTDVTKIPCCPAMSRERNRMRAPTVLLSGESASKGSNPHAGKGRKAGSSQSRCIFVIDGESVVY